MKIVSLEVDNHPVLGTFQFNFDDQKNTLLLVGKNGSGKTKLMDFLHTLLDKSFRVWELPGWKDGITRIKLVVKLDEAETQNVAEMNVNGKRVPYSLGNGDVYFEAERSEDNWNDVTMFMQNAEDNQYVPLPNEVKMSLEATKPLGKVLRNKARYSGTQINFKYTPVTSFSEITDDDNNIKTKAAESLADEINKLLVATYNNDNAKLRKLVDSGETLDGFTGDFDRFRDAYHELFTSKRITGVEQDGTDNKVMLEDISTGQTFGIDGLSSGEQQVVYRVGYLLQNLNIKNGGVVFIDEPELSLHPEWQINYLAFIDEIFGQNIQFVIATHSPYIVQSALQRTNVGICRVSKHESDLHIDRLDTEHQIDKTTVSAVNYNVFGVHPEEYHTELYLKLSGIIRLTRPGEIDKHLLNAEHATSITTIVTKFGVETIMSFVRNIIHHGDDAIALRDGRMYLPDEIEQSIQWMEHFIAEHGSTT